MIKCQAIELLVCLWNKGPVIDPVQIDLPPEYDNENFTVSGLDDKAVRRLFIRKVMHQWPCDSVC